MARLFTSGFELNSVTDGVEFTTNNATVAIVTTNPRTGTYHGRVSGASNGFWRQNVFTSNQATVGYIGVAVCIHAAVNATTQLVRFSNVSNALQCNISMTSSRTLVLLKADGSQIGSASAALTVDTWYYIELKNDASGAGSLDARIDGVSFASGANSSAGTWGRALIGVITGTQTTADIYFDDFKVNDSSGSAQNSWPGLGKVAIVRPNGAGETTQWTPSAGANYTTVDEVTPNDATDSNSAVLTAKEDLYTVNSLGLNSYDTINVVQVGARFNNATTADATTAFKLEIEKASGGTKLQSASIIPNSTTWRTNTTAAPDTYVLTAYTDPDAAAWTSTTLDSMRIGVLTGAIGVFGINVSTMWAYVDYLVGTPPSFNTQAMMGHMQITGGII